MKRITLLAAALSMLTAAPVVLADGMTFRGIAGVNGAIFRSASDYAHGQAPGLDFDTKAPASEEGPVIVATETTAADSMVETGGFFANGDTAVIWNPGDGATAPSDPPAALLYILDEDAWNDSDNDPFDNNAIKAYVTAEGVWQSSDQAVKSNVSPLGGALDVVRSLNGYSYDFVRNDEELQKGAFPQRRATGIMAQELQQVLPEAVTTNGSGEMWVNYSQITPVLIEAIKEQQAVIDELRDRLDALDGGSGAPTR